MSLLFVSLIDEYDVILFGNEAIDRNQTLLWATKNPDRQ
jgi:hypothetical protein